MPETHKVTKEIIMAVYNTWDGEWGVSNRTDVPADPPNASTTNGVSIYQMLRQLQEEGVNPGTKLRITIEIIE